MNNKPKIDEKKVGEASFVLKQIITLTQKYNDLFQQLNPQEKLVTGGIVFRILNLWDDARLVGIMVDRTLVAEMMDTLIVFYQHPEKFTGSPRSPIIAISDKDDVN
jgi:predicted LPLAT superfamily acyltransferase